MTDIKKLANGENIRLADVKKLAADIEQSIDTKTLIDAKDFVVICYIYQY